VLKSNASWPQTGLGAALIRKLTKAHELSNCSEYGEARRGWRDEHACMVR
jgi:hypothetical protein